MEPIAESTEGGVPVATRRPSRAKAAVAAIVIAGTLSVLGVASVFAASPSPSAAGSSGTTTTHNCPWHADSSST